MKRQPDFSIPRTGSRVKANLGSRLVLSPLALLVCVVFLAGCGTGAAPDADDGLMRLSQTTPTIGTLNPDSSTSLIQLTLSAPFTTLSWDERDPDRNRFELPVIYLHRQREKTPATDRTLQIGLSGLAGERAVVIEAVSQHEDVSTGQPITVTAHLSLPDHPCTSDHPCLLQWVLDATTPGDLYYLRVRDEEGNTLWENPGRPAFVMLDTWDVVLDDGQGEAYVVRVIYASLFPFARGEGDLASRLPPNAVTEFVAEQFVPIIEHTWHTQIENWGFGPLHADWDADKMVEVIVTAPPYALFDGTGTKTAFLDAAGQPYPERRIWWLSAHDVFGMYDSLANAYRAIFAHEFFHLAQWNVLLHAGYPGNYWTNTFIEAQAEFAVSAQYPELEIDRDHLIAGNSAYANSANRFLAYRLNTSYQDMEADPTNRYDLAPYWRFLYEQYGDMSIIRAALEEMVRHHEMAQHQQTAGGAGSDIVGAMREVMNAALARFDGPFSSFEESIIAFARANFALRLANGRCATQRLTECGGQFYDPDRLYVYPSLEANLYFRGTTLTHDDAIPSSYGMDFVKIHLDPTVQGKPLTVQIQSEGANTHFEVQVWKLQSSELQLRAVSAEPETVPQSDPDSGKHEYTFASVDTTAYDQLALIITRLDPDEEVDPVGNYHLTLWSDFITEDTGT